jgi:hypothetical protein
VNITRVSAKPDTTTSNRRLLEELYKDYKTKDYKSSHMLISEKSESPSQKKMRVRMSQSPSVLKNSYVYTSTLDDELALDRIKKQNEETYAKLAWNRFSHEDYLNSPSYKLYLENQEQRHSAQISELYQQNSKHTQALTEKLTQVQLQKTEIEREKLMEVKDREAKLAHVEIKYQTDTTTLYGQLDYANSHIKNLESKIQVMQQQKEEHDRQHHSSIQQLSKVQHELTEVDISNQHKISSLTHTCAEQDQHIKYRNEEVNQLNFKIAELEKSYVIRIENMLREKEEQERRYFEKSQELAALSLKFRDQDVQHSINLEQIHLKLTDERNADMEARYNIVIQELYSQIAEWEKKYNNECVIYQGRLSE